MEIGANWYTFLITMSGLSWTIVYLLVIYRSFRDKLCGMPFWALTFNLSWEFIFSFVFTLRPEIQFVVRLWFILDLVILVTYLLYGRREWPQHISRKLFYPHIIFAFVTCYFFVYLMSLELNDFRGMYTAFISNLMMSLLFISMFINRQSPDGQSPGIALFKMLGTLAPTILLGQESRFVLFVGISCFVADVIYIIMLVSYYQRLNLNLLTRRPHAAAPYNNNAGMDNKKATLE